jgi:lysine-N-methylase
LPEAARIVLLNEDGISFIEKDDIYDERTKLMFNTDIVDYKRRPIKYFWDMRTFSFQIIKSRDYSLSERLIILGMFYDKVQKAITNNLSHTIPEIINEYCEMTISGKLKGAFKDLSVYNTIQMELLKELIDEKIFTGIQSKRFMECFSDFLHGINYTYDDTKENIASRYEYVFKEYYEPFIKKYEYILENYLVKQLC